MTEQTGAPSPLARLLADGPLAVNVGVGQFADELRGWDPDVISVDWRPPSGGPAVRDALWRLSEPAVAARVEAANERVIAALLAARPFLVDGWWPPDSVPSPRSPGWPHGPGKFPRPSADRNNEKSH